MTALIISHSQGFAAHCTGALQEHGCVTATASFCAIPDAQSDILILDVPQWEPALYGALGWRFLVVVSANWRAEYGLPPGALFFLKPVDIDCMVDKVLSSMGKPAD